MAEYYEGCTLQNLLEEGALRDDVIVKIIANVTYALKYIHDRGTQPRWTVRKATTIPSSRACA